jgi:cytochrome c-type biogenesis protein CcmH/NrfG
MTTALLVIGSVWLLMALVFCVAICAAAAKPTPKFETISAPDRPMQPARKGHGRLALCAG